MAFVLIWPPVFAIYEIYKAEGSIFQRIRQASSPSPSWGPYLVKDRRYVTHLGDNFEIDPRNVLAEKGLTVADLAFIQKERPKDNENFKPIDRITGPSTNFEKEMDRDVPNFGYQVNAAFEPDSLGDNSSQSKESRV